MFKASLAWHKLGQGDLREELEKQEPQEWSQAGATFPQVPTKILKLISAGVAGRAFEDLSAVLATHDEVMCWLVLCQLSASHLKGGNLN